MKIQCDVCEKNSATVICCADEAALCAKCDVEVHAANKLASKHQRLQLHCLSNKLPTCDICQEKAAFIFCVEDRALFCQECDESIHSATTLAGKHQRYLATGIKVGLAGSKCSNESSGKDNNNNSTEPSNQNAQQIAIKLPSQQRSPPQSFSAPSWAVDDLLEFSQLEESSSTTHEKNQNIQKGGGLELGGEIDWWNDMTLFGGDQFPQVVSSLAAAEVPQIRVSSNPTSNVIQYNNKWSKASSMPQHKKPRIEISRQDDDDDEFFIVPDLG